MCRCEIFPEDAGLIVADAYGARSCARRRSIGIAGATRRSMLLRFARARGAAACSRWPIRPRGRGHGILMPKAIAGPEIERLIQLLARLPGLGPRSARRAALVPDQEARAADLIPKDVPLNTTKDYENYIARLNAFSQHTDDHIELMRVGIAQHMVLPAVVLEGYESSLITHLVDDATKSLLFVPFKKFPPRVSARDQARLTAAGREAIEQQVIPSFRRFYEFMKSEYVPACRGSISASELPNGRDFYRHRVRMFTTLDLTPEQVHETGLAEVKRIRQEMEAVIKKVEVSR